MVNIPGQATDLHREGSLRLPSHSRSAAAVKIQIYYRYIGNNPHYYSIRTFTAQALTLNIKEFKYLFVQFM
jgi:hypothetical protein